jgi:hypothetical protein
LIRGKFSFEGLEKRKTSRSSYGTKKVITCTFSSSFDSTQIMGELELISYTKSRAVLKVRQIEAQLKLFEGIYQPQLL